MEDEIIGQQNKGVFSNIDPRTNIKGFLVVLIATMLVLAAIGYAAVGSGQRSGGKSQESIAQKEFKSVADRTVVYGFWEGQQSKINAVNLKDGNIYEIASLPTNIKKVSVISSQSLMFINKTDIRDHGSEIASYDTSTKLINSLILAEPGFGIDDYVLSPSKRFIALWEVSIPQDKDLSFGTSRVYTVDLQNRQAKNLIYDENLQETIFAHYPVAITDSGEVFMDRFKPNTGAGWANGMSVSDLTGSQKQDVSSMLAGTYSTQPQVSPDGKYLVFAGYNGVLGAGTSSVGSTDGFKQAILSPNTIDILDISTKQRIKLPKISADNRYPQVLWDGETGKISYVTISKNLSTNGQYLYDIKTQNIEKVKIGNKDEESGYGIITSVGNGKYLAGQQDQSSASLGNLGQKYAQALSQLGIYDNSAGTLTPIAINSGLVQYIASVPSSFFSSFSPLGRVGIGKENSSNDQLQLQTFAIKPSLEPIRVKQQSNPPVEEPSPTSIVEKDEPTPTRVPTPTDIPQCRSLAAEQCNELLGMDINVNYNYKMPSGGEEWDTCVEGAMSKAGLAGLCADSPLFLYGEKGTRVNIYIGTQISNSNAPYDNGYKAVLTGDGGAIVDGNIYKSIDYDYLSAIRRIPPLNYGKIVKSNEAEKIIKEYGLKLGLTEEEANSIVDATRNKFNKKYVFVSFFNDEISKAILPISFDPTPDVYRNIVFFFKEVDALYSVNEPKFEKYPERKGFTAVEVSYIIE